MDCLSSVFTVSARDLILSIRHRGRRVCAGTSSWDTTLVNAVRVLHPEVPILRRGDASLFLSICVLKAAGPFAPLESWAGHDLDGKPEEREKESALARRLIAGD